MTKGEFVGEQVLSVLHVQYGIGAVTRLLVRRREPNVERPLISQRGTPDGTEDAEVSDDVRHGAHTRGGSVSRSK
jgi:hypothetical protein